jgi:NAD(P)-dependent dehydrogenase (short-subunit alcohol dehydrogenase family)
MVLCREERMYRDLEGKVAVVTGSGKKTGIGYAIAEKLAASGTQVIIADLGTVPEKAPDVKIGSWQEMQAIARELNARYGVQTLAVNLDVVRNDSITRMVQAVREKFGRVDVLCNNAGASFGVPSPISTYDEVAWMKTIDVNLHGVFRVSRAILPLMQGGGSIINTASRAGKVPPLFNGAYAVAKAGVIMLTKVMARELAPAIRVNAICPGQIMTDLEQWRFDLEAKFYGSTSAEREQEMIKTIPLGRIGTPPDVANLAAFLGSSESAYMTGQAINITGGQLMEL